ncbi:MAG: hypothetical protein D6770_09755, partial [Anaerolineae bacterium]
LVGAADVRGARELFQEQVVSEADGLVFKMKIAAVTDRLTDEETDVKPQWVRGVIHRIETFKEMLLNSF